MSTDYYGIIAGEIADRAAQYNVPVRTCAWCEEVHPENISVPWLFVGDYLYFCTDLCVSEWGEHE
jgi:hypothetical protein